MTREIFTSVTRVLSILITKQQLPVQVQKEWILKRVYQRFHVLFRLSAMRRGELSTTITQLMSKCLWKGWRWYKGYKEIVSPFTCCPVNREYSWMKSQIEKKRSKLWFTTCTNRLSMYVDVDIVQKPVHWVAKQINRMVSKRQEPP